MPAETSFSGLWGAQMKAEYLVRSQQFSILEADSEGLHMLLWMKVKTDNYNFKEVIKS